MLEMDGMSTLERNRSKSCPEFSRQQEPVPLEGA